MWPILGIISCFTRKPLWIASVSAVIWGGLHSLVVPTWGLIAWWPFLVLSLCFLEWRKKSLGKAVTVTALVHTCQNTLVFILLQVFLLATPPSEHRTTQFGPTTNTPSAKMQEVKPHTGGPISGSSLPRPTLMETTVETKPSRPKSKKYQWGN